MKKRDTAAPDDTGGKETAAQKPAVRRKREPADNRALKDLSREDIIHRLAELAFGNANDAVQLALSALREEPIVPEKLDLSSVAECKVSEKGVEVKLVDRLRALETLYALLQTRESGGAEALCRALTETGDGEDWNDDE